MTVEQKDKLVEEMEKLLANFEFNNSRQKYNGMKKALEILGYKVDTDDEMGKVIITEK